MDRDTVARIEEWEERPFSGGYGGLRELAAAEFSGAVDAGATWLFMLNGRVIGVYDGSMAAVEGAEGTAYEAPHPSLPLLFAMRERGGETEARYYTDDTPLSEVDDTLREGSFTGYLELSENVLSGDYYVVYYGGRSLSAAFIGNEERLLTGDEAFERADDEVGIYEVRSVELEVTDVPEPEDAGAAGGTATTDTEPDDATPDEPTAGAEDATAGSETAPTGEESRPAGDEPTAEGAGTEEPTPTEADPGPDAPPSGTAAEADDARSAGTESGTGADEPAIEDAEAREPEPADAPDTDEGAAADASTEERDPDEDPFSEEEEWRETRTIPALDPEESDVEGEAADGGEARAAEPAETAEPEAADEPAPDPEPETSDRETALREAIAERDETIDRLEERLESVAAERDDLREKLESVREERDRLRERVDQLEAAEAAGAGGAAGSTALEPEAALDQTDLFLRYGSKGEATLEEAHSGSVDRETVESNLRLEVHTRFDADDATVGGRPFGAFLEDTLEYRFVEWVVHDLLYEIRETGNEAALRELYDALPTLDRASFRDEITVRDEDGEEVARTFDVTFRDRMGQPLIVANLNDDRDPATGGMMADLAEAATEIAEGHDTLGGAFLVTASFFEPEALETAAEATGGGLLNRGRKRSFVRLARKEGYHLCLVEARDEAFHVAVPEL